MRVTMIRHEVDEVRNKVILADWTQRRMVMGCYESAMIVVILRVINKDYYWLS